MSEHWIEDTEARKRFWAFVKNTLNLTEDEAHTALGVESTKDFDGDMHTAKALLEDYAANVETYRIVNALQPQDQQHAEARVVAFADIYAPNGVCVSLTAREGATADSVALTALALVAAMETLEHLGWATNGRRKAKEKALPHAIAEPPEPVGNQPPQPPSGPGGNGAGSETFLVESIVPQVSPNGNRYYAVRGGRVKKHGATAWPEIAEPQIKAITNYDITNLEIGSPWDVSGWNIVAVGEIPEGKQYPTKVLGFEVGGEA
jgi:hypothetical protein